LSFVDVPARAAVQAEEPPEQVITVLAATTTWPRSLVVKRGANDRSADATGAAISQSRSAVPTATHPARVGVRRSPLICGSRRTIVRLTDRPAPPTSCAGAGTYPNANVPGTGA
jgi:hypothetical protein